MTEATESTRSNGGTEIIISMKQRSPSELARSLEQLQSGEFTGDIYSLLHEFGEADFQEAAQTNTGLLQPGKADDVA